MVLIKPVVRIVETPEVTSAREIGILERSIGAFSGEL